jgi:hypothetical protein
MKFKKLTRNREESRKKEVRVKSKNRKKRLKKIKEETK